MSAAKRKDQVGQVRCRLPPQLKLPCAELSRRRKRCSGIHQAKFQRLQGIDSENRLIDGLRKPPHPHSTTPVAPRHCGRRPNLYDDGPTAASAPTCLVTAVGYPAAERRSILLRHGSTLAALRLGGRCGGRVSPPSQAEARSAGAP